MRRLGRMVVAAAVACAACSLGAAPPAPPAEAEFRVLHVSAELDDDGNVKERPDSLHLRLPELRMNATVECATPAGEAWSSGASCRRATGRA